MRSLAPELPVAGTRPLAPHHAPALPTDADAWSDLATQVAETDDPNVVAAAVARLAAALGAEVELDRDIVVLQRTFGALHRRAVQR